MRRDESLRRAALLAIERAGAPSSVTELWTRLLCDRWQVVERFDAHGRRYFVAAQALRLPLSARERLVATNAADGRSNKAIAIDLGVSLGSVSSSLASALRKIGLGKRADLVALGALAREEEAA